MLQIGDMWSLERHVILVKNVRRGTLGPRIQGPGGHTIRGTVYPPTPVPKEKENKLMVIISNITSGSV